VGFKSISESIRARRALIGSALAICCGLGLWWMPLGKPWADASYDYLFRFGARNATNKLVLIQMDNAAYDHFHQDRSKPPWDRALHAQLLNRLAADGCSLVVFDIFFGATRDPASDSALVRGLQRQGRVVLMAEQAQVTDQPDRTHPHLEGVQPIRPDGLFLNAAGKDAWGIACLDPDSDWTVRRHWPFPSPGPSPSLAWRAAQSAGAKLSDSEVPQERWLRYYAEPAWASLSYQFALAQATNYYRGKIVFIGNKPRTVLPDNEKDKFRTPYTRWTREAVGGMEIQATEFLNLMNGDWLQRPAGWEECLLLIATGVLLGGGVCRFRPLMAGGVAAASALLAALGAILCSYFSSYWFPWLVVAGGQVPCALIWAILSRTDPIQVQTETPLVREKTVKLQFPEDAAPVIPDYELVEPAFGQGGFGKVWLARNAINQWQAVKVVYQSKFGTDSYPYDAEFNGVQRYKPISEKHPGLLRVELVSKKRPEGFFFYVMELGDSRNPGWEQQPSLYKPKDLEYVRKSADGGRLPAMDCLSICITVAEALDFLHREGLTHRDIKPSNVIFVNGHPKLADVGLVAEARTDSKSATIVGTLGYMPLPPERPGTVQADIYALGMVLYVISTGVDPQYFPELSTTLIERSGHADFMRLNAIIRKACQPDCAQRYQTTTELLVDLREAARMLEAL
jgi:CHASE2 domain-containing sensor protein